MNVQFFCFQGHIVSQVWLKTQMQIRVDELGDTEFKIRNGWMSRFVKRFGLATRRITGCGRSLPKNAALIADAYLQEVRGKIDLHGKYIYSLSENKT